MIIQIKEDADLYHFQTALETVGEPIALTLTKLAELNMAYDPVEIQIHKSLLPESYAVNPTMFASTLSAKTNAFVYVRGLRRYPFVVFLFTNDSTPASFIKRVKQAVNDNQTLEVPVEDIPETYRYQLHLLRHRVKTYTGHKLKIKKLKTKHVYSRA